MNRDDYYRTLMLGVILGMVSLATLYMIDVAVDVKPVEATPPKPIVEVVGTYKECEIIQYTNKNLARYSYMLYCGEQK